MNKIYIAYEIQFTDSELLKKQTMTPCLHAIISHLLLTGLIELLYNLVLYIYVSVTYEDNTLYKFYS